MGIGSHQSKFLKNEEWYTPPEIIESLGKFHLDPCTSKDRPWDTAKMHYTRNGLTQAWFGRVWCNPPYGTKITDWVRKMSLHNNGIMLIFARTDTKYFHEYIFRCAKGILFLKGRVKFHNIKGEAAKWTGGAPSCLVGYGERNAKILKNCGLKGKYVDL